MWRFLILYLTSHEFSSFYMYLSYVLTPLLIQIEKLHPIFPSCLHATFIKHEGKKLSLSNSAQLTLSVHVWRLVYGEKKGLFIKQALHCIASFYYKPSSITSYKDAVWYWFFVWMISVYGKHATIIIPMDLDFLFVSHLTSHSCVCVFFL